MVAGFPVARFGSDGQLLVYVEARDVDAIAFARSEWKQGDVREREVELANGKKLAVQLTARPDASVRVLLRVP